MPALASLCDVSTASKDLCDSNNQAGRRDFLRTTGGSGGVVVGAGAGSSASVGGERLRTGGRGVVAASSSSSAIGALGQFSAEARAA